ncbi:hypothetical protein KXW38_000313, partial [Aspergillus fumigatus]
RRRQIAGCMLLEKSLPELILEALPRAGRGRLGRRRLMADIGQYDEIGRRVRQLRFRLLFHGGVLPRETRAHAPSPQLHGGHRQQHEPMLGDAERKQRRHQGQADDVKRRGRHLDDALDHDDENASRHRDRDGVEDADRFAGEVAPEEPHGVRHQFVIGDGHAEEQIDLGTLPEHPQRGEGPHPDLVRAAPGQYQNRRAAGHQR